MSEFKFPKILPEIEDELKKKKADAALARANKILNANPPKKEEQIKQIGKKKFPPVKPKNPSWEELNKARKEAEQEVGIERGKKKKKEKKDKIDKNDQKIIASKALKSLKDRFDWEPDEEQFDAIYKKIKG